MSQAYALIPHFMAVKKIEKEFCITDSSLNCYSFRLLTSGYLMSEYEKNPIGYHMHDREAGVLVRWEDLRMEGDKVFGKPVINMSNPRAEQTCAEIEDGFLNAASVGHIVVIEYSDDPNLKLPGQTGPTVTKWYNRETSLVDIPGNYNALAKLYDDQLNEINLSDFTKTPKLMQGIILSAAHLSLLMLSATASEADVTKALNELSAKAAKVDALEKQLSDLAAASNKKEVEQILTPALNAGKITKELHDKLAVDYAQNPVGLKAIVEAIPAPSPITDLLGKGKSNVALSDKVKAMSWDELMESGEMANLKANHPDYFKEVYRKEFGKDPV